MSFLSLAPGYPKQRADKAGVRDVYLYRGLRSIIATQRPKVGAKWRGLEVLASEINPIDENPNLCEMTVEVGSADPLQAVTENPAGSPVVPTNGDGTSATTPSSPAAVYVPPTASATPSPAAEVANEEFPYIEVEQVPIERALRTHPAFVALTAANWNALDLWEKEPDGAARAAFQYWVRDADNAPTGTIQTLPSGAVENYAKLRLNGVEVYTDFAPIVRKTSLFKGNAAPTTADMGNKITAPDGAVGTYEWLKSGDSARKAGRGDTWTRTEEWTGVRKILVDKDNIYI